MPSTSITWDATLDQRTCPICKAMHGYTWTFGAKEGVPDILVHPTFGVVWIVGIGSQAHGHSNFNCRCEFHTQVNVNDLKAKVEVLLRAIEQNIQFEIFERYGHPVGAFRDISTGRFVSRP